MLGCREIVPSTLSTPPGAPSGRRFERLSTGNSEVAPHEARNIRNTSHRPARGDSQTATELQQGRRPPVGLLAFPCAV
eukprot:4072398-Pyramimonas_sp.AAC.1